MAGNNASAGGIDFVRDPGGAVSVFYSLIGNTSGTGVTTGTGSLLNIPPVLAPLDFYGGTTETHALLRFSPAIDSGPPVPGVAIPGLFNTGVSVNGTPLPAGVDDPNYQLVAQPGSGLSDVTVTPDGAWVVGDPTKSRWIGVNANTAGPPGNYTYRTTFDLTGFNPATASLSGLMATDDAGISIQLNGTTVNVNSGFSALTPFSFTTGFVTGVNTLEFRLNNGGGGPNATGLRVEGLQGTAVPLTDQRGMPFARVSGGRIDIGAFEVQLVTPSLVGDYNLDGAVNAADYTVWRDSVGQTGPGLPADGNGDNSVNNADLTVWQSNYGASAPSMATTIPEPTAGALVALISTAAVRRRRDSNVTLRSRFATAARAGSRSPGPGTGRRSLSPRGSSCHGARGGPCRARRQDAPTRRPRGRCNERRPGHAEGRTRAGPGR